ncbi:LysR family transcriptional regulator [[Clostridium] ultunense Esp]|nr:LysR family transcriptional regulator [[Clostridium] ultunense Esp]
MNTESYRLFCLAYEEGSFSQAARLMYLSQPSVTRHIRLLEEEYGTLLFERSGGKLKATEAGRRLYPYAKGIVDHYDRSLEEIKGFVKNKELHIALGATFTIGEYWLPPLLGEYRKRHPEVNLRLEIGNTPLVLEKLRNFTIDMALIEGKVEEDPLYRLEKFAEDELILVCSAHHPWADLGKISISDLPRERFIFREPSSGTRMIVEDAFSKAGVLGYLDRGMELGSTQAIKGAVEANLGVSILPRMAVKRELVSGTLKEVILQGMAITRDLWLVQMKHRFRSEAADHFFQFIRERKV